MRASWAVFSSLWLVAGCGRARLQIEPPPSESNHQSLVIVVEDSSQRAAQAFNLTEATWPSSFSLEDFDDLSAVSIEALGYEESLSELELKPGVIPPQEIAVPCRRGEPSGSWMHSRQADGQWQEQTPSAGALGYLIGNVDCDRKQVCSTFANHSVQFIDVGTPNEAIEVTSPGVLIVGSRDGVYHLISQGQPAQRVPELEGFGAFGSALGPAGELWITGRRGRLKRIDTVTFTSTIVQLPTTRTIHGLSFSPSGDHAIAIAAEVIRGPEPDTVEVLYLDNGTWRSVFEFPTDATSITQATATWLSETESLATHGGRELISLVGGVVSIESKGDLVRGVISSNGVVYMAQRIQGIAALRAGGTWESVLGLIGARTPEGMLPYRGGLLAGAEDGYLQELQADLRPCPAQRWTSFDMEQLRLDGVGNIVGVGGFTTAMGAPVVFYPEGY